MNWAFINDNLWEFRLIIKIYIVRYLNAISIEDAI